MTFNNVVVTHLEYYSIRFGETEKMSVSIVLRSRNLLPPIFRRQLLPYKFWAVTSIWFRWYNPYLRFFSSFTIWRRTDEWLATPHGALSVKNLSTKLEKHYHTCCGRISENSNKEYINKNEWERLWLHKLFDITNKHNINYKHVRYWKKNY